MGELATPGFPVAILENMTAFAAIKCGNALAVVYLEFEKERGKSLIGKKFKEQRVYCPR